jgi:hypothetical protein
LKPIVKRKRIELGEGRSKQNKTTQSIVLSSSVCFLLKLVVRRGERRVGVTRIKNSMYTTEFLCKEKKHTHLDNRREKISNKKEVSRAIVMIFGGEISDEKVINSECQPVLMISRDILICQFLRELLVSTIFPRRSSQKTH